MVDVIGWRLDDGGADQRAKRQQVRPDTAGWQGRNAYYRMTREQFVLNRAVKMSVKTVGKEKLAYWIFRASMSA